MTMKLVMDLVTTVLLLVALVAAQKPSILDRHSVQTNEEVKEDTGFLVYRTDLGERHADNQTKEKHNEKSLNESVNCEETPTSDAYAEGIDSSDDNESADVAERYTRKKRKLIFRGGSYSQSVRRSGGATGGDDPYGRRRDHYDPSNGPYESWLYRQPDIPYVDTPMLGNSRTSIAPKRSDPTAVYGTVRTTPTDSSSLSPSSSSDAKDIQNASVDDRKVKTEKHETPESRTKTGKLETPTKKLSKSLKWEIAKFALQHGTLQAVNKFEDRVGGRLPLRKVVKFIKRYEKLQKKKKDKH